MEILTASKGKIQLFDNCDKEYMSLYPEEVIDKAISYISHNLIPEAEQENETEEINAYKKSLTIMLDEQKFIDERLAEALDILEVVNIFEC